MTKKAEGMLSPYRILDLTDIRGIYCGQLLSNLGADVIKIERPGGDLIRNIGPFYHNIPDPEKSLFWLAFNTNKRGITLNIETADGKQIFRELVKGADVVLESYNPRYLDEIGLGYSELDKLNPGIIMTSITPMGQTGPYHDYKASDLVCWAISGLLFISGDPDKPPVSVSHIPFAFMLASMDGAWSTAIALYWRGMSGKGQHIDISTQESTCKTAFMMHERWQATGMEFERGSSHYHVPNSEVVLRLVWQVKDGYIMYMIYTGQFGVAEDERLVKWVDEEGMADDYLRGIDWSSLDWRSMSREEGDRIQNYFVRFFKTKTKSAIVNEALKRRIMIQSVNTPKEILGHYQLEARSYWQQLEHSDLGVTLNYPSRFCLLSETPGKLWCRAPHIGEHNQEVYHEELGFSVEELVSLKQAGII